jgi:hypothetical protein
VKRFVNEKERMNVLNEFVQDALNTGDEDIEDDDAENLIKEMTA